MYRVPEFISDDERLGAIQHGMIAELASRGIGPRDFVEMNKQASNSVSDIIDAAFKLSFGAGIPIGVATYAVSRALTPTVRTNRALKRQLDEYNDVVAQYENQVEERKKEDAQGQVQKAAASPIVEGLGTGLLAGGSLAAVQAIVSDYLEAKRQRELAKKRKSNDVSPDTVVLYLPKNQDSESQDKAAEAGLGVRDPANVKVEPAVESKEIKYDPDPSKQPREVNGRYSTLGKSAQENTEPVSNGVWIASLIAGAPLGYAVVRKIHDKLEENSLKRQIAAAQKQYVDLLSRPQSEKTAEDREFLDMIWFDPGIEKRANIGGWIGEQVGGAFDNMYQPLANLTSGGVATAILSAIASAYVTNRVMHKQFDPPEEDEDEDKPKVKKVLFKQGSGEAYEITPEQFLTTIAVMRDCMAESTPFEKFAAAFAEDDPALLQYRKAEEFARSQGFNSPYELAQWAHGDPNATHKFNLNAYKFKDDAGFWARNTPNWLGRQFDSDMTPEQFRNSVGDEMYGKLTPEKMTAMQTALNNQQYTDVNKAFDKGMDPEAMKYLVNAYGNETFGMGNDYTYENFAKAHPEVAGKLAGVAGSIDPSKIKGVMMQYMRSHPHDWLGMIGDKDHAKFREAAVNHYMQNAGGIGGWFMRLPVVGNWIQSIVRGFADTNMGKRMMMRKALSGVGVEGDEANAVVGQYKPGYEGWSRIKVPGQEAPAQQTAGKPAQTQPRQPAQKPVQTAQQPVPPQKPAQPQPQQLAQPQKVTPIAPKMVLT